MSGHLILVVVISYFLGTIPFALIITKVSTGKNPGSEGSGNYGALNTYEITNKKTLGLLVFLCDAIKGGLAVCFAYFIIFPKFFYAIIAALFVVLGHDYNFFLRFKGGRGLATALGSVLVFNPLIAIIWIGLWVLFYRIVKQDILFANKLASLVSPIAIISAPDYIFYFLNYNFFVGVLEYKIFSIVLCMLIFAAHFRNLSYEN